MRSKKPLSFKQDTLTTSTGTMNPLENINAILSFLEHLKKNMFEFDPGFIDEFETILLMDFLGLGQNFASPK